MPFYRSFLLAFFVAFSTLSGCSKRNYNVDAETMVGQPDEKTRFGFLKKREDEVALADTARPNLALVTDSSAAANDPKKKKRKQPKNKKEFLGYPIKRGYTKSGSNRKATIEQFYYLPEYVEPSRYAPAKYYYNTKEKKILRDATIDPKEARILHGPYKKMINRKVVEEGYYYIGTRHLRWESYRINNDEENILLNKIYYEKGFPRDAIVNYYDAAKTKIKEVIPYADGKLNGEYVLFFESGLRAWDGQYENGKRVGVWNEYWPFRNRKRYEWQYPQTADAEPAEPFLLKEYNRSSNLIYEKGKLDKREASR